MNPAILLVGKTGQVGAELLRLLPNLGSVAAPDRADLDLGNPEALRRVVRDLRPQLIVNAAAYTQVDQAEKDFAAAHAVNAEAPGLLAAEAKRVGAALVHFSTDYVFDGLKKSPYLESDPPHPINVYGKSKLAGEQAILASGASYLILRTAWVYARRGRNFLLTILRLSTEREELRIVNDQRGAPTASHEIAAGTARILAHIGKQSYTAESFGAYSGVYHMTAAGETSWFDFAQAILEEAAKARQDIPWIAASTAGLPRRMCRLTPISTNEYPTPARRPAYSVLSNAKFRQTFGFQLPHWRTQLNEVFQPAPREESSRS